MKKEKEEIKDIFENLTDENKEILMGIYGGM